MNDNFFQVFLKCGLLNKNETYDFIANKSGTDQKEEIIQLLMEREKVGNLFIADQIILPHLESPTIPKSKILFMTFEPLILWDHKYGKIKIAIVILLKKNETKEIKQKFSQFTRSLADETYLEELYNQADERKVISMLVSSIKSK